jgi:hypothetical protein
MATLLRKGSFVRSYVTISYYNTIHSLEPFDSFAAVAEAFAAPTDTFERFGSSFTRSIKIKG